MEGDRGRGRQRQRLLDRTMSKLKKKAQHRETWIGAIEGLDLPEGRERKEEEAMVFKYFYSRDARVTSLFY